MRNLTILALSIFYFNSTNATTWDEPWAKDVIKRSDNFILGKVISSDEKKGVKIEVLKNLSGEKLDKNIEITSFYNLTICSSSAGHGPEFLFKEKSNYYFFIKKNKENKYSIATPSTGFDKALDSIVIATYRHSYHQAKVPIKIYEMTMTAIHKSYKNEAYDTIQIANFINENLREKPADWKSEEGLKLFFKQHVALETVYHLKITKYDSQIIPFLIDTANFHSQVSAARALQNKNSKENKELLMKIVEDTSRSSFLKVICLWSLQIMNPIELEERLIAQLKKSSKKENGFGGNIMDPRICTRFPSVRRAILDLLDKI